MSVYNRPRFRALELRLKVVQGAHSAGQWAIKVFEIHGHPTLDISAEHTERWRQVPIVIVITFDKNVKSNKAFEILTGRKH